MSIRFRHQAPAFLPLAIMLLAATPALAGSWQNSFSSFGTTITGDLYTPTTPGTNPAVMVAMHYCGGQSSDAHGWFQSAADQYGFYIIAPKSAAKCFVAYTTRDASKEPAQIVKMVQWLITNKNADASRVFAAGYSSGGCMTNTLLAIYPDVFAGGAALPGYPAGSWSQTDTTCSMCGAGGPGGSDTGQKYADIVKGVFAFSGTRPCVQQWVGGSDAYSFAEWLPVVVSEFQILGSLGSATAATGPSGWARQEYKDTSGNVRLQTNVKSGQGHNLAGVVDNNEVVKFLGLDKPTGACGISTSAGGGSSTGGASSVAAGGTKAAGGTTSVAVGGSSAAAGGSSAAAGGTKAAGGASAAGGSSAAAVGGTKAVGGASAAGGSSAAAVGGTKAAGGASAAGGTKSAGGASAAGGTKAAGGASAAGGANTTTTIAAVGGNGTTTTTAVAAMGGSSTAATTDQTAAGGSSNAAQGGNTAAGGNEAVGGASVISSTSGTSNDQGGCGCRIAGNDQRSGTLWGLGLLGAAFAAWRRRQRKVS